MPKKNSRDPQGESPGRFKGRDQHGWSPDVDETSQQDNPSAHRSFHPDRYAPDSDARREPSAEDKKRSTEGTPVESRSRRGEDQARKSKSEGMHDTGPKGRTRRPSGSRDATAHTGVDPQDARDRKDSQN
ncbi:hypothetical protein [Streptomyces sp. L-9-10]|uniref:hypothetical protein n=1 Tax=Streptomyces sp. L-9-10 TaxID=1478131 RepID=UPI00101DDC6A|nr:hypothetical protein [Streptomyces sp. L-9-10]